MILVTGAGGTVGTALLEELKSARHAFRAAFHSQAKADKARAAGLDAVALDFEKPETLRPAMAGVDAVFLLGSGGAGQVEREINVVNAARAAGVKKLVKLSVWGAAEEGYSFAKLHRPIERAVEASGLAWTFLRANGFMQNFVNHMAGTLKAQGAIYQPAADTRISHVDVRDIARVAARALTASGHEGKAYDLSGPQAFSYGEAAEILSRALGRKIAYVPLSDEAAKAGMLGAGIPEHYAEALLDLYRYYRKGVASAVSPAVKDVTGREPTSFEQFARDHADAWRV
ncbi:SDR family oxidoreductase [Pyxidicoccus fallax]|uniref:SDR family oxidoreductase n=1 Tax=Pyxidicoccus fallax TaxID=394095 RepID=A0A848L6D7_9BACT|nr:SDR family oxidoreductase [Pyxidicoccus fallax]NMO14224.1 SDR family oxidoreductase [Pyxidicoccus fallax]NPC80384.1 SDR family oxidoreductase [Pyxidicoccus fallax]